MTRWFPIAPGTSLPAAPAVVDGQITATQTVPVWNETVLGAAVTRTRLVASTFDYALSLPQAVVVLYTQTQTITTSIASEGGGGGGSSSSVLWHFDGSDGSTSISSTTGINATLVGEAQLSTAQQKFGTASLYLAGSDDYIKYDSGFAPATDDFTFELWINYTLSLSYADLALFGIGPDTDPNSIYAYLSLPSGRVSAGSNYDALFNHQDFIAADTWHHVALYRISSTVYLAVNGVVSDTPETMAGSIVSSMHFVGAFNDSWSSTFKGYIDEVRYTHGAALYGTSNFTPPSAPFSS